MHKFDPHDDVATYPMHRYAIKYSIHDVLIIIDQVWRMINDRQSTIECPMPTCGIQKSIFIVINLVGLTSSATSSNLPYFTEYNPMLDYNPTAKFSTKSEILKLSDYNPMTIFNIISKVSEK